MHMYNVMVYLFYVRFLWLGVAFEDRLFLTPFLRLATIRWVEQVTKYSPKWWLNCDESYGVESKESPETNTS